MSVLQVENGSFAPLVCSVNGEIEGSIKILLANRSNVFRKTRRTLLDNNTLDSKEAIILLNEVDHYLH